MVLCFLRIWVRPDQARQSQPGGETGPGFPAVEMVTRGRNAAGMATEGPVGDSLSGVREGEKVHRSYERETHRESTQSRFSEKNRRFCGFSFH